MMWIMTVQDVKRSTPHATFVSALSPDEWIFQRLIDEPEIKYAMLWSRQVPDDHAVVGKLQEMRES